MKIYSDQISSRLEYTLHIIFNRILMVEFVLTDNTDDLIGIDTFINYSDKVLPGGVQIQPSQLLFEEDIIEQELAVGNFKGLPVLFFNNKGTIPYDLFSAVFYMVTRYEEYLPFNPDKHGRFKVEDSIAHKHGFHQVPIVEFWVDQLSEAVNLQIDKDNYRHLLTVDVDYAWIYKNVGFFRTTGGAFFNLLRGHFSELIKKFNVWLGMKKDPGDNYAYLDKAQKLLKEPIQYFFQIGTDRQYDKAHSFRNKEFRELIKGKHRINPVGFHPSFKSNSDFRTLQKEYLKLCSLFKRKITRSRQHYLIVVFPDTFRNIIKLGIRQDFSMGWTGEVGFRAGISRPFPFYDLKNNISTHLQLVPFAVMDRTLKDYMMQGPDQAVVLVKKIIGSVKAVGGQFAMIWHNDSLSNQGEWKGWRRAFEKLIEYAE